jgi:heme/copper-type cytochrome/quinol oxidase subunit 3
VWVFIGGDVIVFSALVFTYLYLRGTDTERRWRSVRGWFFNDYSPLRALRNEQFDHPPLLHESVVSVAFTWAIVALVVLSAALFWFAENRIRLPRAKPSKFIPIAAAAALVALVACVAETYLMRNIPQYFSIQNDSQLFIHTAYGSAMLAFGVALIIHMVILAFLGTGLSVRAVNGKVTRNQWYQVRFVRYLWVWVATSTVLTALITEIWH